MLTRFCNSTRIYKVQEVLGESQSCWIYKALRTDKNFPVKQTLVIKLFKQKKYFEPALQMESLLKVGHSPHLVKALGFELFKARPALLLEYIPGVNLKELLQQARLSAGEAHTLCAQILNGLKELKKKGLAHGDLSLSNILIDKKGQVYLTDYGPANYIGPASYGTEPFIAPELYKGEKASWTSDLFSLGVLEKVLTGAVSQRELKNLKSAHFVSDREALLHPEPHNRTARDFSFSRPFSHLDVNSLSEKVRETLFIKNCLKNKPPAPFAPGRRGEKKSALGKLLYWPFSSGGAREKAKKTRAKKINRLSFSVDKIPLTAGFLLLLLTGNPFISYGQYTTAQKSPPGEVLIRTRQWTYIRMAGTQGYTPIDIPIAQTGAYKLKWNRQDRQGLKHLYLKAGQKILLTDKDFL